MIIVQSSAFTETFALMRRLLIKLKQSQWWRVTMRALERWDEVDGDQRAAAFAYYLLLSLFPLIIMLVTAGSLLVSRDAATRDVIQVINHYAPLTGEERNTAVKTIGGLLDLRDKMNVMAIAVLVWGSHYFLQTLIRTANRIWRSHDYNWWRLPLKSLGLLCITGIAIGVGILLPPIARLIQPLTASYSAIPQWAVGLLFQFLPWLVLFGGFLLIYKLAPSRFPRFSQVWIGAAFATVAIWVVELAFFFYATHLARFNAFYGKMGGVMMFLLWVDLSSWCCVFGVCLCAAQAEIHAEVNG